MRPLTDELLERIYLHNARFFKPPPVLVLFKWERDHLYTTLGSQQYVQLGPSPEKDSFCGIPIKVLE